MAKRVIRFGLYGCNMYRTKDLMDAAFLVDRDAVEVGACFDIVKEKADAAALKFGGKACYNLESFLGADFDVALISLPPFVHAEAYRACAEAGKDMYLEKPICVNDEGRRLILDTHKQYNPYCFVGLSYAYVPQFRKALEIARREGNGKLLGIYHHWMHGGNTREAKYDNWRHKFELSGGQLNHHCCHLIQFFRMLGGEPKSVLASSFTSDSFPLPHEEEELNACFKLESGIAIFNFSQRSHRNIQYGHINFENISIYYEWGKNTQVRVHRDRPRAADEVYEWDAYSTAEPEEGFAYAQMKDFMDIYMNEKPLPTTVADGIQVYDIVGNIRESCRTGNTVIISPPAVSTMNNDQ